MNDDEGFAQDYAIVTADNARLRVEVERLAANEELIATLTKQAREGDEAVAAIARVRSAIARGWHEPRTGTVVVEASAVLRALDGAS